MQRDTHETHARTHPQRKGGLGPFLGWHAAQCKGTPRIRMARMHRVLARQPLQTHATTYLRPEVHYPAVRGRYLYETLAHAHMLVSLLDACTSRLHACEQPGSTPNQGVAVLMTHLVLPGMGHLGLGLIDARKLPLLGDTETCPSSSGDGLSRVVTHTTASATHACLQSIARWRHCHRARKGVRIALLLQCQRQRLEENIATKH